MIVRFSNIRLFNFIDGLRELYNFLHNCESAKTKTALTPRDLATMSSLWELATQELEDAGIMAQDIPARYESMALEFKGDTIDNIRLRRIALEVWGIACLVGGLESCLLSNYVTPSDVSSIGKALESCSISISKWTGKEKKLPIVHRVRGEEGIAADFI